MKTSDAETTRLTNADSRTLPVIETVRKAIVGLYVIEKEKKKKATLTDLGSREIIKII